MNEEVGNKLVFNREYASKFARLALAHVTREYPNKLDHVLLSEDDIASPRALHPIFFGSFDWHSCVHGYWLLARVLRRFPDIAQAHAIRALFDAKLTRDNVAVETAYVAHSARGGFERPYGWAWLLMLQSELLQHDEASAKPWSAALQPLADVFVARFRAFLPKATYPVRVGTHYNSAFAITLSLEYAHIASHQHFAQELKAAATHWYITDSNAQAWEPSADDFLSSTLIEAVCMQRTLEAAAFRQWFDAYLPHTSRHTPTTLFNPATVSDRTDGKTAHLDGLNLSRAWCWRLLALAFVQDDPRRATALATAEKHLNDGLDHIAGDYMGEHWLATFALLALDTEIG